MKHLAAVVLLALAKKNVDEASVKAVLEAGGVKGDAEKIKKLVESLKGKDVLQFAKEGLSKASSKAAAPAEVKVEKKETKKKEEKKEEEKPAEEEDAGGFGDLFG